MHEQAIIRKLMHVVSTIRADLSQNVHCKFSLAANRRQYTTCNVLCKFPLTAKLRVRCSLKPFPLWQPERPCESSAHTASGQQQQRVRTLVNALWTDAHYWG